MNTERMRKYVEPYPCPHWKGEHRNTESSVPASYFLCKCGYSYRGAERFA